MVLLVSDVAGYIAADGINFIDVSREIGDASGTLRDGSRAARSALTRFAQHPIVYTVGHLFLQASHRLLKGLAAASSRRPSPRTGSSLQLAMPFNSSAEATTASVEGGSTPSLVFSGRLQQVICW